MNLKPCPFCGSDDLHAGSDSVFSHRIMCWKCGAQIIMEIPEKAPKESRKWKEEDWGKKLCEWNLRRIAKRWNRRCTR